MSINTNPDKRDVFIGMYFEQYFVHSDKVTLYNFICVENEFIFSLEESIRNLAIEASMNHKDFHPPPPLLLLNRSLVVDIALNKRIGNCTRYIPVTWQTAKSVEDKNFNASVNMSHFKSIIINHTRQACDETEEIGALIEIGVRMDTREPCLYNSSYFQASNILSLTFNEPLHTNTRPSLTYSEVCKSIIKLQETTPPLQLVIIRL